MRWMRKCSGLTVLAGLLVFGSAGCASLKPPVATAEMEAAQKPCEEHPGWVGFWTCVGIALQIVGPWLASK